MKIRDIIESASVGGISAGAIAGGPTPSFQMQRRTPKKKKKKTNEKETLNPPSIDVGDEVKVGKFKNSKAEVKGFKKDEHGQPVLKTTKGDQKLYKPRVSKLEPGVKESKLSEGVMQDAEALVKELAQQANKAMGPDSRGRDRFRHWYYPVVIKPAGRVWTRGDGVRYRDPPKMYTDLEKPVYNKFVKVMGGDPIDLLWEMIKSRGKPQGKVKGEFGSSSYDEAYSIGRTVYIKRDRAIIITTPSAFRNTSIWNKKNENVEEAEIFPDVSTPSAGQIARKHGVKIEQILQQLKKGIQIEKEHTGDSKAAKEIALDHLNEFPDYYDRLEGVEEGSKQDKLYKRYSKITKDRTGKTPDEHHAGFQREKDRIQDKLDKMNSRKK